MRRSSKVVSVLGISETGEGGTVRKRAGRGAHLEDRLHEEPERRSGRVAVWLLEESGHPLV